MKTRDRTVYDGYSQYHDLEGAMRYLSIGKSTVQALGKASGCALKIGRRTIYCCDDMVNWLKEHPEWCPKQEKSKRG